MLEQAPANAQLRVKQIDAALARIAADDYGFCVKCGDDIPTERLNFESAAPMGRKCAGG